jgi:cell division protein DivIC
VAEPVRDKHADIPHGEGRGQPAGPQDFPVSRGALKVQSIRIALAGRRPKLALLTRKTLRTKSDSSVTARRVIIWIYAGIFVGVGLLSGGFFFQTYREYAQLQRVEVESRQRLAQAEQRLREQEQVLDRLRTDPAYVAKIIRQQLRYAKPSEFIFRFPSGDAENR